MSDISRKADAAKWAKSIVVPPIEPELSGTEEAREILAAEAPEIDALTQFLSVTRELDVQRTLLAPETPPPLSRATSQTLIEDCAALLGLDENRFDEICGSHGQLIQQALSALKTTEGREFRPGDWPTSPLSGQPIDGTDTSLVDSLKRSLRAYEHRSIPQADAIDAILVEKLVARIERVSADAARAAYSGNHVGIIESELRSQMLLAKLEVASHQPLPEWARAPYALILSEDRHRLLAETTRVLRGLDRELVRFPGEPTLKTARELWQQRAEALNVAVQSARPSRSELAELVADLDGEKLKTGLQIDEAKLRERVVQRLSVLNDTILPTGTLFETWRGPRGPPEPGFPRSLELRQTFGQIGIDPLRYLLDMSAISAEHKEFYRAIEVASGTVRRSWEFGRQDAIRWALAQISSGDLAQLDLHFRGATVTVQTPADETAERRKMAEWKDAIREAIAIELTERQESVSRKALAKEDARRESWFVPSSYGFGSSGPSSTPGGTPGSLKPGGGRPGHPPSYPPDVAEVREIAGRYAETGRQPNSLELQIRVAHAMVMYGNVAAMPEGIRAVVREATAKALDSEMVRLQSMSARLNRGPDGLYKQYARIFIALPDGQSDAITRVNEHGRKAVEQMALRFAAAEGEGLIEPDRIVWAKLRRLSTELGGVTLPESASRFEYRDFSFERTIGMAEEEIEKASAELRLAEQNLKGTPLIQISTDVSGESGRVIAKRGSWSSGSYDFMALIRSNSDKRYRDGVNMSGFQKNGRPYDYRKVKQFNNFDGVAGGIHFGTVSEPTPKTQALIKDGARLEYDSASKMLSLRLTSGNTYKYGPIEPRYLKSLYAYVTSDPMVNMAISIGATGDGRVRSSDESTVLLDPNFVDTPVGQVLYLADTIPWALNEAHLANGVVNPIAGTFTPAFDTYRTDRDQRLLQIAALVRDVKPAPEMTAADWEAALTEDIEGRHSLGAYIKSSSTEELSHFLLADMERKFKNARKEYFLKELPKLMESVVLNSRVFEENGYTADDLTQALNPTKRDFFAEFGLIRLGTPTRVQELVQFLKNNDSQEVRHFMELVALHMNATPTDTIRKEAVRHFNERTHSLVAEATRNIRTQVDASSFLFADGVTQSERILVSVRWFVNRDESQIRVPRSLLRIAGSAVLGMSSNGVPDDKEMAVELVAVFGTVSTLAVLHDTSSRFTLQDSEIMLQTDMRYTYVTSDYGVFGTNLVFKLDINEKEPRPIRTRKISSLASAANDGIEELSVAFPPLEEVHELAALAAFLRWASCPDQSAARCETRDRIVVDFSELSAFNLRDRTLTPTPDAEIRK